MARRPRSEEHGAIHHVVPQGVRRGRIVHDDIDRHRFVERLGHVAERCRWSVLGYSVLDTHLHVVVRTSEPNLGVGMRQLLGWYAHRFNQRVGEPGPVFAPRFWSRRVEDDSDLLGAVLYAELNPVAAGICSHPAGFPWCSYRHHAGLTAANGPVVVAPLMDAAEHRALVDELVPRALAKRDALREVVRSASQGARPVVPG